MLHTSPLDTPGTKDAGGMNVVVRAQAEALVAAGHEVRVFTRRADPEAPERVRLAEGLEVVQLDAGPARLLAKGDHEAVMAAFGAALAEELRAAAVDVLHAEHWFSGIAALPVARQLGMPLVQSFHSIAVAEESGQPGERSESQGRMPGERLLAREADLLLAVSEAERQQIVVDLGGDPDRVRVVVPGVDTELFRPLSLEELAERDARLAEGDKPELLVVGRLHPLKAFDLALDALALIPEPLRPRLCVVGSPPPDGVEYARGLREQAQDLGLGESVAFEGALGRESLAARMRLAALVLVPSHTETFGLVALEAAASGVPVVARAAGGLREAVVDGMTGTLVAGGDPRAWASAIAELLGDSERAQQFGAAAREHALRQSWDASAQRLIERYRDLLGS